MSLIIEAADALEIQAVTLLECCEGALEEIFSLLSRGHLAQRVEDGKQGHLGCSVIKRLRS